MSLVSRLGKQPDLDLSKLYFNPVKTLLGREIGVNAVVSKIGSGPFSIRLSLNKKRRKPVISKTAFNIYALVPPIAQ